MSRNDGNASWVSPRSYYYYYFYNSSYYYNESAGFDSLLLNAKMLADEDDREAYLEYVIEGVTLTVVSCLGLVGNCMSFLALANVSIGKPFANLLR